MGRDWKSDPYDFLLAYCTTPHSVTNISPAQPLFKRNIKDKLPIMPCANNSELVNKLKIRDQEQKEKRESIWGSKEKKQHSQQLISVIMS